ncbi:MAG: sulfite exporter TauE/SafE family protein [Xanthobacteraceae bacterium]
MEGARIAKTYAGHVARFPNCCYRNRRCLVGWLHHRFAGFGTGLVASGIWLHALPAAMVPPLVALASVAAQLVGLVTVRKAFDWSRAAPYLAGGLIGVPLGVAALAAASPFLLRASIGAFLIAYATYQLLQRHKREIGGWGGKAADAIMFSFVEHRRRIIIPLVVSIHIPLYSCKSRYARSGKAAHARLVER